MKSFRSWSAVLVLILLMAGTGQSYVSALVSGVEETTQESQVLESSEGTTRQDLEVSSQEEPAEPSTSQEGPLSTEETETTESQVTEEEEASTLEETTESPAAQLQEESDLTAEKEAIIGADNRVRVTNLTVTPYRQTVLLGIDFPKGKKLATGVLVGPNLVLTSHHNVHDLDSGGWAKQIIVIPAYTKGTKPYGTYKAANMYVLRDSMKDLRSGFKSGAVIRLDRNVDARVGYLPVSTRQTVGESIQVLDYAPGKDYELYKAYGKLEDPGSLNTFGGKLLVHKADNAGPGGPVLNARNEVIGIHSSYLTSKKTGEATVNGAARVSSDTLELMAAARNNSGSSTKVAAYKEPAVTKKPVYRLYHPGIQRHLYTQSVHESNVLRGRGWLFEGTSFETATSGTPVYRLYSPVTREHLYTTDAYEYKVLGTRGWKQEGIAWYSNGTRPIFRLYHPGIKVHLYTSDINEVRVLTQRGWRYEGVSWYALEGVG